MRQPPTGKMFPSACEKPDVSGERKLLAAGAQKKDDAPPARSARKARRPYGRGSASSITAVPDPSAASPLLGSLNGLRESWPDRVAGLAHLPGNDELRQDGDSTVG